MATLREIRRRIAGVKSTQKITKAMKMVAAAKLRRAQEAMMAARPYARKMRDMLGRVTQGEGLSVSPLLESRDVRRVAIIVVTADRGLCGAFNANILKAANEHVRRNYPHLLEQKHGVRFIAVGKKGFEFLQKRNFDLFARHIGIFHTLDFSTARAVISEAVSGFLAGEFDRVEVVYNEFKSVIQQHVTVEQLLPIPAADAGNAGAAEPREYIFEASRRAILDDMLPKHLNFQMWRILLESNASEQGARMTAMGNATENAKELISSLTLSYNKARQAGITKELLEIVSGAEALKKAS